MHICCF